MSMLHEYLDRPPTGWFALDVMRKEWRKWDWVALMINIHSPLDIDYRPLASPRGVGGVPT